MVITSLSNYRGAYPFWDCTHAHGILVLVWALAPNNCSTHWFFHSDRPSVWGWKAVEMFCWALIWVVSAFLKWEVN